MNLFGTRKSAPSAKPNDTSSAIAKVREALDNLGKREEHLKRKVDQELAEAKKFTLAKNKRDALRALKRKQAYDKQLDNVSAMIMTLDQQRLALEEVSATKVTVDALETSKVAMEAATRTVKVENIDKLVDEMQELHDKQNDVTQALATPMFADNEEDARRELEELEQEMLNQSMMEVQPSAGTGQAVAAPSVPATAQPMSALPSAPTTTVAETDEERELRELQESMAM